MTTQSTHTWLAIACLAAFGFGDCAIAADRPAIDVSITVDLGRDLGQNFGTLFEARDKSGRLVAGAGFVGVYNTRYRSDRYQLQFFVRPRKNAARFTRQQVPRSTTDSGVYLYGLDGHVFADGNGKDAATRRWDASHRTWVEVPATQRADLAATRVRGKLLALKAGRVLYDGRVILDRPSIGRYLRLYYAKGFLFFYHQYSSTTQPGFNRVVAVPWTPYGDVLKADPAKAISLTTKYPREFPYAYGQFGNQVVNCSNIGGLYVFDGKTWRTVLKPDDKVSYQIYSMINYRDRLLMGQYPTGRLLEYDGAKVIDRKNTPPVLTGVSSAAREAQTTTIYRGELFAGVWPWSELWRLDPDNNRWTSMGRMFTHPAITAKTVHPYEARARKQGLVVNELGQRLTALVPHADALWIGTSSKSGSAWKPSTAELFSSRDRNEYGAIHRLTMPGNLAANIRWTGKPITLRFVAKAGRISVQQDGRELGSATIPRAVLNDMPKVEFVRGKGVFGPLSGSIKAFQSR